MSIQILIVRVAGHENRPALASVERDGCRIEWWKLLRKRALHGVEDETFEFWRIEAKVV